MKEVAHKAYGETDPSHWWERDTQGRASYKRTRER